MDLIEKFLKANAYKFPKGYPNMKDPKDVLLLESLLSNILKTPIKLNEASLDVKKDLIKMGFKDEDIIIQNSKRIRLLTNNNERKQVMDKLISKGYKFDPNFTGSSLGAVIAKDGTAVMVKPRDKQGAGSVGLDNEHFFINKINEFTQDGPINVIFKGNNKTLKYNNVSKALEVGRDTKGGKKADVKLLDESGKVISNISIKKNNAQIWESADRRYKNLTNILVKKLLNGDFKTVSLRKSTKTDKNNIYRLYNPKTDKDLGIIVIKDLPKEDNESIIFGTDVPKTVVIKQTFEDSNFNFINGVLTIKVNFIASSLNDIEGTEYEPILVYRHDVTRPNTYGLRPIVHYKSFSYKNDMIKSSQIELDYNDIVS